RRQTASPTSAAPRTGSSVPVSDARRELCPGAVRVPNASGSLRGSVRRASYIGRLVRVLIAPDKFRGTLTAAEASRAIATGWSRARPDDEVIAVPMADGGEGTLDALIAALGGDKLRRTVTGPLGDPVDAE